MYGPRFRERGPATPVSQLLAAGPSACEWSPVTARESRLRDETRGHRIRSRQSRRLAKTPPAGSDIGIIGTDARTGQQSYKTNLCCAAGGVRRPPPRYTARRWRGPAGRVALRSGRPCAMIPQQGQEAFGGGCQLCLAYADDREQPSRFGRQDREHSQRAIRQFFLDCEPAHGRNAKAAARMAKSLSESLGPSCPA